MPDPFKSHRHVEAAPAAEPPRRRSHAQPPTETPRRATPASNLYTPTPPRRRPPQAPRRKPADQPPPRPRQREKHRPPPSTRRRRKAHASHGANRLTAAKSKTPKTTNRTVSPKRRKPRPSPQHGPPASKLKKPKLRREVRHSQKIRLDCRQPQPPGHPTATSP